MVWPKDTKLYLIENLFGLDSNAPIKMNGPVELKSSRKFKLKIRIPKDFKGC